MAVFVLHAGLRWNLEPGMRMQVGGLVSTCNVLAADEVHVQTDGDLVWTTALQL